MEDEDQYRKKGNMRHPSSGVEVAEDTEILKSTQAKIAIEGIIKEFLEEKEMLQQNIMEGQVDKKSQSQILTDRFGAEFTKRFKEVYTAASKDGLLKHSPAPTPRPEAIPVLQPEVLTNALPAFINMQIAHEICVNNEYRIKLPEKLDTLEARVIAMTKKAFWDLVDEDLNQSPPNYDSALKVFEEIREKLIDLLLPNNGAIRLRIEDTLDVVEIRKQVVHEALDFYKYVNFTVDCLAKLCSPSRDHQVAVIRTLEKPSEIFRQLFDVMEVMQLDMANFLISLHRPKIMEECIGYERNKFMEFLELEYDMSQDGLRNTREWLLRHKMDGRDTPSTIAKAFGEFLCWDPKNPWPETVALDALRLRNVARVIKRATIFGAMSLSVMELSKPFFGTNYPVIYNTVRMDLDSVFKTLLPLADMGEADKIVDHTKSCAEEAVRVVAKHITAFESKELSNEDANLIRHSVNDIILVDNKVRSLLMMRILQFVEEVIASEGQYKVPLTPGLTSIRMDVEMCSLEIGRIASLNRDVYNDIYCDIVEGKAPQPNFDDATKDPAYANYIRGLKTTNRSKERSNSKMTKQPLPGPSPPKTLQ